MELAFNCVEEITYSIIKPSIEGLNNPYDNDSEYNMNNKQNENQPPADDPVFEYLLESNSTTNWNTGAPAELKNPLTEPLKNIISRRSLSNDQFEPVASTSNGITSSTKRSCSFSKTADILQSKKLKLITVMEERMKERESLDDLKEKVLQTKLKAESLKLQLLEKTVRKTNDEIIQNAHDYEDFFNISDSDE
ncbi:uncharacterized protein [Chelonus insularis]|uniref:uncharacterized protein n=1 Tax=Chelonus insularis TaxID=460826 RepID=UPI0015894198|nr:uncharacterized protein LOC118070381 [Chelonus insularis]XP_034944849.1 uncharacterized protein LOC118070381 [Chelonus insularis]